MEDLDWFGHASFSFKDKNGNRIYFIDPFQIKHRAIEKADIIFITHAHPDHFSKDDINEIIKNDTFIVAPSDILEKLETADNRKITVEPNKNYEILGFNFQTFPAYNNHPSRLQFHPKKNNWVGYIFILNGKKIYHAGDTDFIEEMKLLNKLELDIAMLPLGGTYTMDEKEASDAANAIAAKVTIPIHYKNLNQNHQLIEESFKTLVKNSKVLILEEFK